MTTENTSTRVRLPLRISPKAIEWADDLATTLRKDSGTRVTRSDVLRAAFAVGKSHENEVVRRLKGSV